MTLTPKVRDVWTAVSATAALDSSAPSLYSATVPRAPASLTAAASAGVAMPPMPAWTRGKSTESARAAATYESAIRDRVQSAGSRTVGVGESVDPPFETESGAAAEGRLSRIADAKSPPKE